MQKQSSGFESGWLSRTFGRVVSQGNLIPVIDGLRFVAICAVISHHLSGFVVHKTKHWVVNPRDFDLFHVLNLGNCGVPLFFALSGFILGMPFLERMQAKQPFALKKYYLRRLTRLEPPYIVNVLLIAALLVVVKGASITEMVPHLLASLVYLHGIIYETMSTVNFVTWSLEIEVQFYLLAPLIALIVYRGNRVTRRILMVGLIAIFIAIKYAYHGEISKRMMFSLPYYADFFLTGMLLADIYLTDWKRAPKLSWVWDILGVVAWGTLIVIQWNQVTYFLLPVATFAAYWCAFRGKTLSTILSQPFIVVTGGMCYTIYLYHFYVISLVGNQTISWTAGLSYPLAMLVQSLIILPAILIVSLVLFKLIERPFMIWRPFQQSVEKKTTSELLQEGLR